MKRETNPLLMGIHVLITGVGGRREEGRGKREGGERIYLLWSISISIPVRSLLLKWDGYVIMNGTSEHYFAFVYSLIVTKHVLVTWKGITRAVLIVLLYTAIFAVWPLVCESTFRILIVYHLYTSLLYCMTCISTIYGFSTMTIVNCMYCLYIKELNFHGILRVLGEDYPKWPQELATTKRVLL